MKIGIVVPVGDTEYREALHYTEIRAFTQQSEVLGFDSVWIYDHLLHRFDTIVGFQECWTTLCALAEATHTIKLGTWVLCTAFRSPALVAKMATTFTDVSDGRLILGLGAGWHQAEFEAFGFAYDYRVSRFEESLQIIVPLIRTGKVNFSGRYYSAKDCVILPRDPRTKDIPILVAAAKPRMFQLTAQYGDGWNTDWLGPESKVLQDKEMLFNACRTIGRDPATAEVTGGITVAYPELGSIPRWMKQQDQYITGSSSEVAVAFGKYASLGVTHIMCNLYPFTSQAIERLGEAIKLYQQSAE